MDGINKVPMHDNIKEALEGNTDLNKKAARLHELNELAYEDLILSINTSSAVGKVAFGLLKNAKSPDFAEENCKITWDWLVNQYTPHTALSLLKLRNEFHNSKLDSIENDPDESILNLEGL